MAESVRTGPGARKGAQDPLAGFWGFLLRLFGRPLALWGIRTGTLAPGFLGRRPHPSPYILRRVRSLPDEQILDVVRIFSMALSGGWRVMEPSVYNGISYAYALFLELGTRRPFVGPAETPNRWLEDTRRAQTALVRLLGLPDPSRAIAVELPEYVAGLEGGRELVEANRPVLNYLADLLAVKPTLPNIFLAFHGLRRDRPCDWTEVLAFCGHPTAELKGFDPPEEFRGQLSDYVRELRRQYDDRRLRQREIEVLERSYLRLDGNGNLPEETFLPSLEAAHRASGWAALADARSVRTSVPLLLFAILKDLERTFLPLLGGSVPLSGDRRTVEARIFSREVFKAEVEQFERLLGSCDRTARTYRDLAFDFAALEAPSEETDQEGVRRYILDLVERSNRLWKSVGASVDQVLAGHAAALAHEGSTLEDTRPLENTQASRLIPYRTSALQVSGRLRGGTVVQALEELRRLLYCARHRFADEELRELLARRDVLQRDIEKLGGELERMGVDRGRPSADSPASAPAPADASRSHQVHAA